MQFFDENEKNEIEINHNFYATLIGHSHITYAEKHEFYTTPSYAKIQYLMYVYV